MKQFLYSFLLLLFVSSCSHESVKEKVNTVGDAAGETAGEFLKGVGSGMDKAFEVKVTSPKYISDKGLEFSKVNINSSGEGIDNLLNVYVIFKKDFSGKLTAKVFDTKDKEVGRVALQVEAKAEEAKYIDFEFDPRTNIDSDFKIIIE